MRRSPLTSKRYFSELSTIQFKLSSLQAYSRVHQHGGLRTVSRGSVGTTPRQPRSAPAPPLELKKQSKSGTTTTRRPHRNKTLLILISVHSRTNRRQNDQSSPSNCGRLAHHCPGPHGTCLLEAHDFILPLLLHSAAWLQKPLGGLSNMLMRVNQRAALGKRLAAPSQEPPEPGLHVCQGRLVRGQRLFRPDR